MAKTIKENAKSTRAEKLANTGPAKRTVIVRKLCLALVIISLITYCNTLQNGYVLDDMAVIENNTLVKKGFASIPELLITPRFQGFEHIINDSYRPLSLVTFAVEYQLFGPNPGVGHFLNILLFAGCVVFLFLFLNKLFNSEKTALVFIAAALFAVHPIHTEVVANIKSRDELLCFFFAFWSLNAFANYAAKGGGKQLAKGVFLLWLSYLSKETVIAFLFVIPIIFFTYLDNNKRRSSVITGATVAVSTVFLIIRAIVLRANDSGAIPFLDNPLVNAPFFSERLPTAIMVLGAYLKLLIIPYPLICDYSYNTIPTISFKDVTVWVSLAIYLSLAITAVYNIFRKTKDPATFGILFFLATIALFSNIPFLVYSEFAERLAFFASAGFCLGISYLLHHFLATEAKPFLADKLLMAVAITICGVFAIVTIYRNADWESNYSLTISDVKKAPNNARLWHSMGYILLTEVVNEEQDTAAKRQIATKGIADLERSLSIYPGNAKAHQDLGNFFRGLQAYDSAEVHLKEAVRLNPTSYIPVSDLGFVYFSEKKYEAAIALSQAALLKDQNNAGIINNIAICYLQMQKYDSAIMMVNKALAIEPGNKLSEQYLALAKHAMERKWIKP